ncbi:phage tail tape measure protein [Cryobacterium sp. TMT1-21]|uniref:phage tail tape measure protein n=1 Tax=Cryobacterium sp. TMT1-21 TaxID=1259234 RepID=UPI0010695CB9|nr:phage tail tape measure protein [Cryobacterium sp. TMT1-21]TFD09826.1 phage tail tape measure protein [Cryobacterium sp. TMT1-21]
MATLRAAELEILFTANTDQVQKADKDVKTIGERIEKKPITQKVKADEKDALAGMDRVEQAAKKLVSKDTALKLDADVTRAEKGLDRAKQRLADLEVRALGGLDVTADVRRAEAALSKIERNLAGLQAAKTQIQVEADTTPAESRLSRFFSRFRSDADAAGQEGGKSFSKGLDSATRGAGEKVGDAVGGDIEGTLISALAAIPIAGGIVLAGVAIGKAISGAVQDGLQVEVGNDRLQALTGISEADALRLGRVAGEAYANVFGDSVEANMDTTRLALQFNLIDADTSTKSAQKVVEGLSGIADVLGEDVRPIAAAVTTLLSSGVAKSAENAFDLLATGAREGVNRSEDLIDTFTEYPALFARLGLSGEEALGLMNQGLKGGARNSDIAADALKEFQIRATDASKLSAEGFTALGLNAEEMTAKIARGGEGAREGLDQVLDGLRNMEDPVARNAAAVALFGTQAEDMGEALFHMDLSTAVEQLGGVTGAAEKMFATLSDNDATKMEQAGRNIEVAADGIKGALAAAFSEPLSDLADFVSQNRGPVMQFMLDLANGALDFGVSMVESTADGTEALGEFIAGPGAQMIDLLIGVQKSLNPFADTSALEGMRDGMEGFKDVTAEAADTMRKKLIEEGLEPARAKLNEFGEGAIAMGFLNDASLRLAGAIGEVGTTAEGAAYGLDGIDLANIRASDSGKFLEDQVRNSIAAMSDQVGAAAATGESQDELAARYHAGTEALVGQLTQMGLTEGQARALIDTVLQTPASATTEFGSNATDQQTKVQGLADRITTLPDGSVVINADTATASEKIAQFVRDLNNIPGRRDVVINQVVKETGAARGQVGAAYNARGNILEFMAQGGLHGLTPMSHTAQVVPPSTWRVVGDRGDVPESFIPIDGSARSMSILYETMRRMGVTPMGAGGINGPEELRAARPIINHWNITQASNTSAIIAEVSRRQNDLGSV